MERVFLRVDLGFFGGWILREEVSEELEAGVLAFFWVELGREESSFFDRSAEVFLSVLAGGREELLRNADGVEGVDEIEVGMVREILPSERVGIF